MAAKGAILVVLAIWVVAASAVHLSRSSSSWPFLSVIYLLVWPIARFIAHDDTSGWGISVQKRPGRLRRTHVGGTELPLGKRVFVAFSPEFSIELAAPRWLEAVYLTPLGAIHPGGPTCHRCGAFPVGGTRRAPGRRGMVVAADRRRAPRRFLRRPGRVRVWGAREFVGPGIAADGSRSHFWARALHRPPRPMRGRASS